MKELLDRLEQQAIEIANLKNKIEDKNSELSRKDNEIVLIQSAAKIAAATFEKQIDKLKLDLREAQNAAKTAIFRYKREIKAVQSSQTTNLTHYKEKIVPPTVTDVTKYSGLGPAIPREDWDSIIEKIVKDVSVPELERTPIKQSMRLFKMLGKDRPSGKEIRDLVAKARKKFGMPEYGPSIPDLTKEPIALLPPKKEEPEESYFGFLNPGCFGC